MGYGWVLDDDKRTSSLPKSKSFSSSTPRKEKVLKVLFFLSSAATVGSVTEESAYESKSSVDIAGHWEVYAHHLEGWMLFRLASAMASGPLAA